MGASAILSNSRSLLACAATACTTTAAPPAPVPVVPAQVVPPAAQSAVVAPPAPEVAASAALVDGGAGLLDPRCEQATDVDIDEAVKARLCVVPRATFEAPTLPKALRVRIDVPPVSVGADATVRASIVNTGDVPLPVVVDDCGFEVTFTDARGKDPHELLGSCVIDGHPVVKIDLTCGGALLRFVLQPGGNVHRDYPWDGKRYRWGARQPGLQSCEVLPVSAVPAGRYVVKASANLFDYGPRSGTDPEGPPLLPAEASATLVVSP